MAGPPCSRPGELPEGHPSAVAPLGRATVRPKCLRSRDSRSARLASLSPPQPHDALSDLRIEHFKLLHAVQPAEHRGSLDPRGLFATRCRCRRAHSNRAPRVNPRHVKDAPTAATGPRRDPTDRRAADSGMCGGLSPSSDPSAPGLHGTRGGAHGASSVGVQPTPGAGCQLRRGTHEPDARARLRISPARTQVGNVAVM